MAAEPCARRVGGHPRGQAAPLRSHAQHLERCCSQRCRAEQPAARPDRRARRTTQSRSSQPRLSPTLPMLRRRSPTSRSCLTNQQRRSKRRRPRAARRERKEAERIDLRRFPIGRRVRWMAGSASDARWVRPCTRAPPGTMISARDEDSPRGVHSVSEHGRGLGEVSERFGGFGQEGAAVYLPLIS